MAAGSIVTLEASFTRPANTTAYAANDLVANDVDAGDVVALEFLDAVRAEGAAFRIERLRLYKSGTSITNASFRVLIFDRAPVPSVGDNGVLLSSSTYAISTAAGFDGWFEVTMDRNATLFATGPAAVPVSGGSITATPLTGTSLYALIMATAAYTPASGETFTVVLEGLRG
jgi:hypothetical protein